MNYPMNSFLKSKKKRIRELKRWIKRVIIRLLDEPIWFICSGVCTITNERNCMVWRCRASRLGSRISSVPNSARIVIQIGCIDWNDDYSELSNSLYIYTWLLVVKSYWLLKHFTNLLERIHIIADLNESGDSI